MCKLWHIREELLRRRGKKLHKREKVTDFFRDPWLVSCLSSVQGVAFSVSLWKNSLGFSKGCGILFDSVVVEQHNLTEQVGGIRELHPVLGINNINSTIKMVDHAKFLDIDCHLWIYGGNPIESRALVFMTVLYQNRCVCYLLFISNYNLKLLWYLWKSHKYQWLRDLG